MPGPLALPGVGQRTGFAESREEGVGGGTAQPGCLLPRGCMAGRTPNVLVLGPQPYLRGEGRSIWPRTPPKGTRGQQERGARGGCRHVQQWVIDKHDFAEVELVGEPLPFGLVENPLVVVVAVGRGRIWWWGRGEGRAAGPFSVPATEHKNGRN